LRKQTDRSRLYRLRVHLNTEWDGFQPRRGKKKKAGKHTRIYFESGMSPPLAVFTASWLPQRVHLLPFAVTNSVIAAEREEGRGGNATEEEGTRGRRKRDAMLGLVWQWLV
jgi:hypothetical protein